MKATCTTPVVTILGAATANHLSSNVQAADLRLSPEHMRQLTTASQPLLGEPHDHNRVSRELLAPATVPRP
jgi:diketogulonate reductase-like aldo/keto reductase